MVAIKAVSLELIVISLFQYSSSWTITPKSRPIVPYSSNLYHPKKWNQRTLTTALQSESGDVFSSSDNISTSLPTDEAMWKAEGERIILSAAMNNGVEEEDIDIQWKSGRIVVTIKNSVMKGSVDDEGDAEIEYDDDDDNFDLEAIQNSLENEEPAEDEEETNGIVSIARAINYALGEEGEGSIGSNIAVHHEIEVTTPAASDELEGIMFEAYKGFDVLVETVDPKNGKKKIVEGNLVKRTDEFTILFCKGQRKKLKNQLVQSVKLPKAKKEKGVR